MKCWSALKPYHKPLGGDETKLNIEIGPTECNFVEHLNGRIDEASTLLFTADGPYAPHSRFQKKTRVVR